MILNFCTDELFFFKSQAQYKKNCWNIYSEISYIFSNYIHILCDLTVLFKCIFLFTFFPAKQG